MCASGFSEWTPHCQNHEFPFTPPFEKLYYCQNRAILSKNKKRKKEKDPDCVTPVPSNALSPPVVAAADVIRKPLQPASVTVASENPFPRAIILRIFAFLPSDLSLSVHGRLVIWEESMGRKHRNGGRKNSNGRRLKEDGASERQSATPATGPRDT
ncbi:hypothetical protein CEXT_408101, partial [Caerostris extrusa]